jgi:hypothetical protein
LPAADSAICPVAGEKMPVLALELNLIEGAPTLPSATVFGPGGPGTPCIPCGPCCPGTPWIPCAPWDPVSPVSPFGPCVPVSPAGPLSPLAASFSQNAGLRLGTLLRPVRVARHVEP